MRQTTLEAIESIENRADDLYRGHIESYVGGVTARALPNLFYLYLDTWPKVTAQMDYDAYGQQKIVHTYTVKFDIYEDSEKLDLTAYQTDKAAYCKIIDEFVERVSKRLLALKTSGAPAWEIYANEGKSETKRYAFVAPSKHPDENRFYPWHETLGMVRMRGGKWVWYLCVVKQRADWPVTKDTRPLEGKCSTLEDAKAVIDTIWKENNAAKQTV